MFHENPDSSRSMGGCACYWRVAVLVVLLPPCCRCGQTPLPRGDAANDLCPTDHVIIHRATYNGSESTDGGNCSSQDGGCLGRHLKVDDLMTVYETCSASLPRGQTSDILPCPPVGSVVLAYQCLEGPVYDPCETINATGYVFALHRRWRFSTAIPSVTCSCILTSHQWEHVGTTRVYFHAPNSTSDDAFTDIRLIASNNPEVNMALKQQLFPHVVNISTSNVSRMELSFGPRGASSTLQILVLEVWAANGLQQATLTCDGALSSDAAMVWLTTRRCDQPRYSTMGKWSRDGGSARREGVLPWGREARPDPVRHSDPSTIGCRNAGAGTPEREATLIHASFVTLGCVILAAGAGAVVCFLRCRRARKGSTTYRSTGAAVLESNDTLAFDPCLEDNANYNLATHPLTGEITQQQPQTRETNASVRSRNSVTRSAISIQDLSSGSESHEDSQTLSSDSGSSETSLPTLPERRYRGHGRGSSNSTITTSSSSDSKSGGSGEVEVHVKIRPSPVVVPLRGSRPLPHQYPRSPPVVVSVAGSRLPRYEYSTSSPVVTSFKRSRPVPSPRSGRLPAATSASASPQSARISSPSTSFSKRSGARPAPRPRVTVPRDVTGPPGVGWSRRSKSSAEIDQALGGLAQSKDSRAAGCSLDQGLAQPQGWEDSPPALPRPRCWSAGHRALARPLGQDEEISDSVRQDQDGFPPASPPPLPPKDLSVTSQSVPFLLRSLSLAPYAPSGEAAWRRHDLAATPCCHDNRRSRSMDAILSPTFTISVRVKTGRR